MRVTRKMMNSNSVYNINANKEHMDKLNTQMATQKKFTDPSDDPITAIRAIRYRTDLSEVSQYLDRNVSDAVSWTEIPRPPLTVPGNSCALLRRSIPLPPTEQMRARISASITIIWRTW